MPFYVLEQMYPQPEPFALLDAFLNGAHGPVTTFFNGLVAVHGVGDGDYGPFAGDQEMQGHWGADWTNADGGGGTYWPYLTDIDIHGMLTRALTDSVRVVREQGKTHMTVWLPIHEIPEGAVSVEEQKRLFTASVHQTATGVQLVIVTPKPASAEAV